MNHIFYLARLQHLRGLCVVSQAGTVTDVQAQKELACRMLAIWRIRGVRVLLSTLFLRIWRMEKL